MKAILNHSAFQTEPGELRIDRNTSLETFSCPSGWTPYCFSQ